MLSDDLVIPQKRFEKRIEGTLLPIRALADTLAPVVGLRWRTGEHPEQKTQGRRDFNNEVWQLRRFWGLVEGA